MRHSGVIAAVLAAVICLLTPDVGHSVGGIEPPRDAFLPDPDDTACPEDDWPHYYYRLPVIFQYTTDAGTLEFFAFGYADGCKYKTNQKSRGGTHANLQILEGFWAPNIMDRYAALNAQARPLTDGTSLPGLNYPGDNAFRWDLPQIRLEYQNLYNEQKAGCRYRSDDLEIICPGIPPEIAALLTQAGFQVASKEGQPDRYLIDLSFIEGARPDAVAGWFGSALSTQPPNPTENFYARQWGTYNRTDHSDGGLFRIILFPVDLALTDLPAKTTVMGDGTAHINVNVALLANKQVPTWVGWRIKGESEWRHGRVLDRSDLAPHTAVKADFTISGVQPGQVVEVMVNPDRAVAEVAGGAFTDAYANNVGETLLIPGEVDLEVVSLSAPALSAPAQVAWDPDGEYRIAWVVRNNGVTEVTGRRTVTLGGTQALRAGTVTLGPGESRTEEYRVPLMECGAQQRVAVAIASAGDETDSNPANNAASRTTAVGDCPEAEAGSAPGWSMTIIVPADCEPNPDPLSDQVCLNYPQLRVKP
ncbi:MAG TPA: hypothetical protein VD973_08150 [Symbiobacteriaceae bacterium]|nr:hypothetical protein [Symbiobacteriaceae bacterium]